MRRSSGEAGFTVIELLVAMTLGLIILTAAMSLGVTAMRSTARTTERSDATQTGRVAMEQMTQGLRSQVCWTGASTGAAPIAYGDATKLSFYGVLAKPSGTSTDTYKPNLYTFQLASGKLTVAKYVSLTAYPSLTFSSSPTSTRLLVGNAAAGSSGAVFSYYEKNSDGTIDSTPLAVPLSDEDRLHVALTRITFVTKPSDGATATNLRTPFEGQVATRLPFPPNADDTDTSPLNLSCSI